MAIKYSIVNASLLIQVSTWHVLFPRLKGFSQPFDNPEDGNVKIGASWHDLICW